MDLSARGSTLRPLSCAGGRQGLDSIHWKAMVTIRCVEQMPTPGTPNSIGKLCALPDQQQITRTKHHARSLLLLALDRDEAHVRALSSLANRFGIGGIALLTRYERLQHKQVGSTGPRVRSPQTRVPSDARRCTPPSRSGSAAAAP